MATRHFRFRSAAVMAAAAAIASSFPVMAPTAAVAQENNPAANAAATAPAMLTNLRLEKVPAKTAAQRLSRASGQLVLIEGAVASAVVSLNIQRATLEQAIAQLVAQLPRGSVDRVVMLPAIAPGATPPDADVVATLVGAQETLVPSVMGGKVERTVGSVNVMGRVLDAEKAKAVIAALDLKPVHLLGVPGQTGDPLKRMTNLQAEGLGLWMSMTQEQRQAAMEQQFDYLLNMDPDMRRAMFGQMQQQAAVMMQKLQSLPEDQRRQFFMDITGGRFDGTGMPPTGGAGNPPQQPR